MKARDNKSSSAFGTCGSRASLLRQAMQTAKAEGRIYELVTERGLLIQVSGRRGDGPGAIGQGMEDAEPGRCPLVCPGRYDEVVARFRSRFF